MKNLFLTAALFTSVFSFSQNTKYYEFNETLQPEVGTILVAWDNNFGVYYSCLDWYDTMRTHLRTDTVDFTGVNTIIFPGTAAQYLRGDGALTAFPAIPDSVSEVVNDAGYLAGDIGAASISGVGATVAYIVAHGLSYTPDAVVLTARSADAANPYYVSSISSTTFTITFTSQPGTGTDNILFDWVAYK